MQKKNVCACVIMILVRCVSKGVWLVRVKIMKTRYRATLRHWHGGVYLTTSAAETTFNSKRESKNRYGHGRSGRTYGYGPELWISLSPFDRARYQTQVLTTLSLIHHHQCGQFLLIWHNRIVWAHWQSTLVTPMQTYIPLSGLDPQKARNPFRSIG